MSVAAESRHYTNEYNRGRHRQYALACFNVLHERCKLGWKGKHDRRTRRAQNNKRGNRNIKGSFYLKRLIETVSLRNQLCKRNRQTRGGKSKQDIIEIVSDIEMSKALVVKDIAQRNFINRAEDFYYYDRNGKNSRSMKIILVF